MLSEMPPEMKEAQALGISFFAGEAEEQRLDQVLSDAWDGKLAPLYNHMKDLPALAGEPPPILPQACAPHRRVTVEHRSRPRLSLSMLLLHDH
jgi:hypothetical protein